jgi:hypothetical protein
MPIRERTPRGVPVELAVPAGLALGILANRLLGSSQ